MSADRNLLFGILALQLDFITRDQLIAGMQTWVLEKSKSLAEILQSAGALSAANRQLLEPLVARHVEQHGNDPQRSLASLSALGVTTAQQLAGIVDPDVNATLSFVGAAKSEDPDATLTVGRSTSTGNRFRVLRFHAAGGLGQVSVARDSELNREVALKEIKPEFASHDVARGRFLLEAQITGGLEHPSIVPVYGLGTYEDGRPFYAMRFIKGDTLKQAIDRFHDPDRAKKTTDSERTLELRQLLGRFIDVCQAVEYAHSRGVLHRDLKPGNVMLGKYGETLVVDWGLAKARGSKEGSIDRDTSEMPLAPQSGSSIDPTEMGQRIGTLQYMSPEQCAGNIDQLGPATDIFALGATLYHLLTGKTVYHATTNEDIIACIASARFPHPRKVLKSIQKPLEAICLKALAEKPSNRYASAQGLLDDIERYLADEPVTSYREPLSVRVRRWARKRPALVSGSAGAVAVTLLAMLIGAIVLGQKNRELAEKEAIATAVKEFLIHDLLELADPIKQANVQDNQLKVDPDLRVQDLFARTEHKIEERFGQQPTVAAELRNLITKSVPPDLTIRALLHRASDKIADRFIAQPLVELEIRWMIGIGLQSIGEPAQSIPHLESCRAICKSHMGADDQNTLGAMNDLAKSYSEAGRLDEAIALNEESLKLMCANLGEDHPDTLVSMSNLAATYCAAGRLDDAFARCKEALKLQQAKLGGDHPDTLRSMNNLAGIYGAAGELDEALALHEEVLRLMQAKYGRDDPETLSSMNNLANVFCDVGRVNEAIPLYQEVLRNEQLKLGADHPQTLRSMANLAVAYSDAGRLDEAIPLCDEALKRMQAKHGWEHPDTLSAMHNLAGAHLAAMNLKEALLLFERTLRLKQAKFGHDNLVTILTVRGLAVTQRQLKNWPEAETHYLIAYPATSRFPPVLRAQWQPYIAQELVDLYTDWEKPDEAAKWRKELEMLQGEAKQ